MLREIYVVFINLSFNCNDAFLSEIMREVNKITAQCIMEQTRWHINIRAHQHKCESR